MNLNLRNMISYLNENLFTQLKEKRIILFSSIFALFFSLMLVVGEKLSIYETIWLKYDLLKFCLLFSISFFVFGIFLCFLHKIEVFLANIKLKKLPLKIFFSDSGKSFWMCFLFITICHIPSLLAFFPGIFTYDVYYQAHFFVNEDFVEQHPLVHSWLIYLLLLFSKKFNTTLWGVFIYTLVQSTFINLVFSYVIKVLNKYNVPFIFKLVALLSFALYPTNQVFPLVSTKDVIFCGAVILFICLILEFIFDKEKFITSRRKYFGLVLSIMIMFLFRHNGIYSYLLILPLLFIYFKKIIPNYSKKIICIFLIPILFYAGFIVAKKIGGVKPPEIASALCIPLQQMGRVMFLKNIQLEETERKNYELIVGKKYSLRYYPYTTDTLKIDSEMWKNNFLEKSIKENPKRFIKLYYTWAKKYPKEYIDAFLLHNYNYFYIGNDYRQIGGHYYLYTKNRWHDFFGIIIRTKSLLPELKSKYNSIFLCNVFDKNLISKFLFAIPYNSLWVFISFLLLAYKKKYDLLVAFSILIGLFVTVVLGPTVLLRYVYQNFMVIPLLFACCFSNIGNYEKLNKE